MKYHKITYNVNYENEQSISNYEMGDFELMLFWRGNKFHGKIPDYVRLYLREGEEDLPEAPLLANPVSWLIFSQKLLDFWWEYIKDDVQVFDAPVYRKDDESKVEGYKLINPICLLDCIDMERSEYATREDGTIKYFGKIYIDDNRVGDHHLFRPKNYIFTVIVSDMLARTLIGKEFRGIAFIRCGETPQKSVKR